MFSGFLTLWAGIVKAYTAPPPTESYSEPGYDEPGYDEDGT